VRGPVIAANLKRMGATAYVLASESWMLPLPKECQQKGKPVELERPVSEDDRRMSVIALTGENRAGDWVMVSLKILEGKKRKLDLEDPVHIGCGNKAKGDYGGGRLMGLLEETPLH
jgi:hypothetical protein